MRNHLKNYFAFAIDDIHHDDTGKWKCIVADRHLGIKDERLFNLKVVRSQESAQSVGEESLTWTPSFSIHKVHPEGDLVFAKEGSWETLSCHVTDHYDSCKWTHDTTECSIDFTDIYNDIVNQRRSKNG